jgi:hypothetical protein
MLQLPKDHEHMANIISRIDKYFEEKLNILFKTVLDYLREQNEVCSISEIERKVSILSLPKAVLVEPLEWLVRKNVIEKFPTPVRLTGKSWIEFDEAAYMYGG